MRRFFGGVWRIFWFSRGASEAAQEHLAVEAPWPPPLTATPGPALMALPEEEAAGLLPSTLMRRLNEAAETI